MPNATLEREPDTTTPARTNSVVAQLHVQDGDASHARPGIAPASILVFSDDWGRHPSSCQHLTGRLLDRYPVTWVNTIGMRTPKLDWATVSRAFEKFRQWRSRVSGVDESVAFDESVRPDENLTIANPKMWPWFTKSFDRKLNRALLTKQLTKVVRSMPQPVTAVTTIPITADLVGTLPVAKWVYYCVDDFGEWPGLDGKTMADMDEDMIAGADSLIAVSEHLQRHILRRGRQASLLTHGVDIARWVPAARSSVTGSSCIAKQESPRIVFWGVVDQRMDYEFVSRLAASLDRGSITFVGPHQDPDGRLFELPRVSAVGSVDFDELPRIAEDADVLVMPYVDAPVTRAMQPLKLKEYLATGKPVVTRDLPSTRAWSDCMDVARTADEFVNLVHQRVRGLIPPNQVAARKCLADEGWDSKTREFEKAFRCH